MPNIDKDESGSWSEAIKKYDAGRKTLSWQPNDFQPVVKIGNAERKAMERDLDPLTMTFRNPEREAARMAKRTDKMTSTLTRWDSIQAWHRNIINHEGGPYRPPLKPNTPVGRRDNHIIANMEMGAYERCPILFNEGFVEGNRKPKKLEFKEKNGIRDMNIISNKYFKNDAERTEAEYVELRKSCIDRYWKGRNVNTVTQEYYRDDKQALYQKQKKMLENIHGLAKASRLPPSIKYSEGASYDIINHGSADEDKLKTALTMQIRTQNRQKRAKIEKELVSKGIEQYDLAQTRKLGRVKFNRFEAEVDRGYDPLKYDNSLPLNGVSPLANRPKTSWDKVGGNEHIIERKEPFALTAQYKERQRARNRYDTGTVDTARSQLSTARPDSDGGKSACVPSLDLSKASFGEPVSYNENNNQQSIKIVRTGGF
jgi:hypothetical protein